MNISIDPKSYILYISRQKKLNFLETFLRLGQNEGPQEFLIELISCLSRIYKFNITPFFFLSKVHLLNSGNYFKAWDSLSLKKKESTFLRLDGIMIDSYSDKDINLKKKYKKMINLLSKSENLIYQSEFAKKAFENIFNIQSNSCVIHNGCSKIKLSVQNYYNISNLKKDLPSEYFVVAGRDIKRKRINQVVKIFQKYKLGNLVVLSNLSQTEETKGINIFNLGLQERNIARCLIKSSKALIHLDSYDWCPNIVVNAIFDKVPVICSNYGGTQEIVQESGYIINEFEHNLDATLKTIQEVKNKEIDTNQLIDALDQVNKFVSLPDRYDLSIEHCASKYHDILMHNKRI